MKLIELFKQPGTYAKVVFDVSTVHAIVLYCEENKIPNALPPEEAHCTLLASVRPAIGYKPIVNYSRPLVGAPNGFEVWKTDPSDQFVTPTSCLVLKVKCPQLVERHNFLMKRFRTSYEYDYFNPHVTFSYNVGAQYNSTVLPPFEHNIVMIGERSAPLRK